LVTFCNFDVDLPSHGNQLGSGIDAQASGEILIGKEKNCFPLILPWQFYEKNSIVF